MQKLNKGKATQKATGTKASKAANGSKSSRPSVRKAYATSDKGARYSAFNTHDTFSGYTIAAFMVAGMVKVSKAGTPTVPKTKAYPGLFRLLTGKTAYPQWTKLGRISKGGQLTAKGLNAISERLAGTARGYSTSRDIVDAFAKGIKDGGKVTLPDGRVFEFNSSVSSSS